MSRQRISVASLVAIVALAMGFVVAGFSLPIDDFWLSIASGRAIAAGADPTMAVEFSWLPVVPDALNPQWGAQLILGAHDSLVLALVVNAFLISATLGLTWMRTAWRGHGASAGAVAMLLVIAALSPHLLARAQSFSLALFAATLLTLERGRGRWWLPPAIGLILVAWANLHGAFIVGILATLTFFLGALVERRDGRLAYGITALVAVIAPLANPVGPDLVAYVVGQPASNVVRAISVEWQPALPWIAVATPFWVLLAIVVAGRILRPRSTSVGEALLLLGLALLAISGIRHLPWFILAAAPIIASDVQAWHARAPRLARALGSVDPGVRTRMPRLIIGLVLAVVALQLIRPALPQASGRLTPDEPVALVDRLGAELPAGACCARILNEQVWGGYLAFRLSDRILTAMDGRLEIRSAETWSTYFDLLHGEGDPAGRLAESDVEWALVGVDRTDLLAALETAGWQFVERSAQGVLLRAPDQG